MSYAYETFQHFGVEVELHQDHDAGDPYAEFDQASRLLWLTGEGRGRDIPRDAETINGDYREPATILRWLTLFGGEAVAIPFRFADYGSSGYDTSLQDEANERTAGFVVVSREKVAEEWVPYCTEPAAALQLADDCARAEFATWKAWVGGEVAGYVVAPGTPEEDSCWGFYGPGDEYVKQEARAAAEYAAFERARRVALTRTYALDPSPPAVPAEFEAWKVERERHSADDHDWESCEACVAQAVLDGVLSPGSRPFGQDAERERVSAAASLNALHHGTVSPGVTD